MPELTPLLRCPVCVGSPLEKLALGPNRALQVDCCRRCGGLWLDHGEVQQLRAVTQVELWKQLEQRPFTFRMRCHDCHTPMERADASCSHCGWTNVLECPACDRPMSVESHAGLRLDLCRECKGVWFDHHELKEIWSVSFDQAVRKRWPPQLAAPGGTTSHAGADALFDTLFYAPDLIFHGTRATGHVVAAAADAASHVPSLLASAPEASGAVFDAAGEAAGSVFTTIVEIIGGIFDGL